MGYISAIWAEQLAYAVVGQPIKNVFLARFVNEPSMCPTAQRQRDLNVTTRGALAKGHALRNWDARIRFTR